MVKKKAPDTREHMDMLFKWYAANEKHQYRHTYDLNEDSVVMDLGAYIGKWSKEIFNKYKCNIYAFEPVKEFSDKAKSLLKRNKKVRVFNYAIGDSNREEEITFIKDGSTFFIEEGKKLLVNVRAINDVMNELNFDKVDLIKMNVEGSEYEILERMIELDLLSKFRHFQLQFHREVDNYKERRNKIHEALGKTHECKYNYEFIWEGWSLK